MHQFYVFLKTLQDHLTGHSTIFIHYFKITELGFNFDIFDISIDFCVAALSKTPPFLETKGKHGLGILYFFLIFD